MRGWALVLTLIALLAAGLGFGGMAEGTVVDLGRLVFAAAIVALTVFLVRHQRGHA